MILLGKDQVETMTSTERIEGLHTALQSVHENKIAGDFVECGIWKGGNIVIAKKFFDSVNNIKNFLAYMVQENLDNLFRIDFDNNLCNYQYNN